MFYHSVHLVPNVNASPEDMLALYQQAQALGEACGGRSAGILFWQVGFNDDQRVHKDPHKNVKIVELAIFRDKVAFIEFHRHPKHREFAQRCAELMDIWTVGDLSDVSFSSIEDLLVVA